MKAKDECRLAEFPCNYHHQFYQKHKMYFSESGVLCKEADFERQEYKFIVLLRCALPMVLNALHNESGHFGIETTASLFHRQFYYRGYAQVICDYIGSCVPCVTKNSTKRKHGMLSKVSAQRPFETLSMDFLFIANDRSGYGHVLEMTDMLTKYAYFELRVIEQLCKLLDVKKVFTCP